MEAYPAHSDYEMGPVALALENGQTCPDESLVEGTRRAR